MEKYYASFSLEPYEKDPTTPYLLVGMGPICKSANLGDVIFNDKYDEYQDDKINDDQS